MTMAQPIVSLIINNYNYGRYLYSAIDSALTQKYENKEIIVVDDGSTDNSREIINKFGNFIVPIFKANGGQASAINAGFTVASGQYIFFLDADDYWKPEKIMTCIDAFQCSPECSFLQHNMIRVNENDEQLGVLKEQKLSEGNLDIRKAFGMHYVLVPTSGKGFARAVLDKIMPIPEHIFRIRADFYLQTMAVFHTKVCAINQPLGFYRVHGHNLYSGILTEKKIMADLELIFAYQQYLKKSVNIEINLAENYYYVRDYIYVKRKSDKIVDSLNLFFRYVPVLWSSDVKIKIKIFQASIFLAMLINADFGLWLFNRAVSYYNRR